MIRSRASRSASLSFRILPAARILIAGTGRRDGGPCSCRDRCAVATRTQDRTAQARHQASASPEDAVRTDLRTPELHLHTAVKITPIRSRALWVTHETRPLCSYQHHDLYRKHYDQDNKISRLPGECGLRCNAASARLSIIILWLDIRQFAFPPDFPGQRSTIQCH